MTFHPVPMRLSRQTCLQLSSLHALCCTIYENGYSGMHCIQNRDMHEVFWALKSAFHVQVSCVSGAQLSNYATFLVHPEQAPLSIVLTALSTAVGAILTPAFVLLLLGRSEASLLL